MSFKKIGIWAVLAVALVTCAFSAAGASALSITPHKCEVAPGTLPGGYKDGSCTGTTGVGSFNKVTFAKTEGVEVANPSAFNLKTTNGGVEFEIKCTGLSGTSTLTDAGETVTGSGSKLTFSGCTVTKPLGKGCVVKGGGGATGTIITNAIKSVATRTGAEAFKKVYSPETGTIFATFEVSGCTTTALNGSKALTGTAAAAVSGGMKAEFTTTSGSALTVGGQAYTLLGSAEQKMGSAFISLGE